MPNSSISRKLAGNLFGKRKDWAALYDTILFSLYGAGLFLQLDMQIVWLQSQFWYDTMGKNDGDFNEGGVSMKLECDPMAVLTEEHSAAEQRNYTGSFCGFVLLDTATYDLRSLAERLKQRWGMVPETAEQAQITIEGGQAGDWLEQLLAEETVDILTEPDIQEGNLVFDIPGAMIAVSFEPSPVPDGEAERYAANNYFWPEAVTVTKGHKAHLMIAVLPRDMVSLEAGKTYVKIITSCLDAENAIGVYTSGTVLEPAFYRNGTAAMEQGELPLLNWLYFGVYQNESGSNGYTIGMDAFGKDELEVLGSQHTPEEVRTFLFEAAYYVLETDATLKTGETIGFAAGQQYALKRGDGVAVDGHSVQIAY